MQTIIDQNLAEQIVYAVKEICGYDINFIATNGIVFASTDKERVGTFHEIGKEVARRKEKIEVFPTDMFNGTREGINIPIFYENNVISIIGISGDPQDIRKYGNLAERITNLFIQEKELEKSKLDKREQLHYLITSLTRKRHLDSTYLQQLVGVWGFDHSSKIRTVIFHVNSADPDINIAYFETEIMHYFATYGVETITYNYPNEYVALVAAALFPEKESVFSHFAEQYQGKIKIGVGSEVPLYQADDSLRSARIALKDLRDYQENYRNFDNLTMEILLDNLKSKQVDLFLKKVPIGCLLQEERRLLQTYFATDMSLQATARALFIHKNTLQYKLNRIETKTGYNPRKFQEAFFLQMALQLELRFPIKSDESDQVTH